jgi:hypothetical protein
MKFANVCGLHRIVDLHIDVVLMQVVWNIFSVAETIKYFSSVDGKQRPHSFFIVSLSAIGLTLVYPSVFAIWGADNGECWDCCLLGCVVM